MKVEQGPNLPTDQGAPGATTDPPGQRRWPPVTSAVGAAYPVGAFTPSAPGWPLGAFAATATYLMVVGLENAAADLERRRM